MSGDRFDARGRSRRYGSWVALPIAAALVFAGALAAAPAGASPVEASVTDVGICFGFAGAGGCQLGFGGTTSAPADSTPSLFSAALVATSGLPSSDYIEIDASSGAPGTQFADSGYQLDNETTQVGCAVLTPVITANSGQTVFVPVPDGCAVSPGDELVVLISGGVTNSDNAGPIVMQLSTTLDSSPVTTNSLQIDATVPTVPTNVTTASGDGSIRMDWTSPDHSGGDPITGYDVYCSETSPPSTSATPSATTDENARSVVVGGLTNGVAQHCVMTAVNGIGSSAPSDEVAATPSNLPGAPAFPDAEPGNHRVFLSWSKPDSRGPLPITGYRVYCSTTSPPAVDPSDLCHAGGGAHQVTVAGLVPGTTYSFLVTAVNANGEGPPSEVVSAAPGSVPSRPWAVRATARVESIVVRWKAPTNDGGAPISFSVVFCSESNPPPISGESFTAFTSTTQARVTGLTSGTPYYCAVVAVNQYGGGHVSAVVTAVPK